MAEPIGSHAGGAAPLICAWICSDILVRACVYGYCVGWWAGASPVYYGYPNQYRTNLMRPAGQTIIVNARAPPLNLKIDR